MARSWGDGTVTQRLHELAFDLYAELCGGDGGVLGVTSYRKLPVLSVAPGPDGVDDDKSRKRSIRERNPRLAEANVIPNWLDGSVGRLSPLGWGEDTAQVTPKEFVDKMMDYVNRPENNKWENNDGEDMGGVKVVYGRCTGIEYEEEGNGEEEGRKGDGEGSKVVTGVRYVPTSATTNQPGGNAARGEETQEMILHANDVIVAAGPWACQAQQWFEGAVQLPMEGVKSTSIVWKAPTDENGRVVAEKVDATALFCGEDDRFGTHCENFFHHLFSFSCLTCMDC